MENKSKTTSEISEKEDTRRRLYFMSSELKDLIDRNQALMIEMVRFTQQAQDLQNELQAISNNASTLYSKIDREMMRSESVPFDA
jgi:predicted nuclease with TOPRIM domain